MSYRDVRLWLAKISDAIAVLGIKRSELQDVSVSGADQRRLIGLPAPKVVDVH